jgi:hypothetical protein
VCSSDLILKFSADSPQGQVPDPGLPWYCNSANSNSRSS